MSPRVSYWAKFFDHAVEHEVGGSKKATASVRSRGPGAIAQMQRATRALALLRAVYENWRRCVGLVKQESIAQTTRRAPRLDLAAKFAEAVRSSKMFTSAAARAAVVSALPLPSNATKAKKGMALVLRKHAAAVGNIHLAGLAKVQSEVDLAWVEEKQREEEAAEQVEAGLESTRGDEAMVVSD